jgi:hypothetical protein
MQGAQEHTEASLDGPIGTDGQIDGPVFVEERIRASDDSHHDPQLLATQRIHVGEAGKAFRSNVLHCESCLEVHVYWDVCLSGACQQGLSFDRSEPSSVFYGHSVRSRGESPLRNTLCK